MLRLESLVKRTINIEKAHGFFYEEIPNQVTQPITITPVLSSTPASPDSIGYRSVGSKPISMKRQCSSPTKSPKKQKKNDEDPVKIAYEDEETEKFARLFGGHHKEIVIFKNDIYKLIESYLNVNVSYRYIRRDFRVIFETEDFEISILDEIFRRINDRLQAIATELGIDNLCKISILLPGLDVVGTDFSDFNQEAIFNLLEELSSCITSNDIITVLELRVQVEFLCSPKGHSFELKSRFKDSFVTHILNDFKNTRLCGFISVAHGLLKYERKMKINKGYSTKDVLARARRIAKKACLDLERPLSLNDMLIVADTNQLRIVVLGAKNNELFIMLNSSSTNIDQSELPLIILFMEGESYYPVKSVKSMLQMESCDLCIFCITLVKCLFQHLQHCLKICPMCREPSCTKTFIENDKKICFKCQRDFKDQKCYKNHIENKVCSKVYKCEKCNEIVYKHWSIQHECKLIICHTCFVKYEPATRHFCYVPKVRPKKSAKDMLSIFIYWDTETFLNEENECVVYLIVSQAVCNKCTSTMDSCEICGVRENIFKAELDENGRVNKFAVTTNFINYLISLHKRLPTYLLYALSHNGNSFDTVMVMNNIILTNLELFAKNGPLKRGNKLVSMSILKRIFFKDTLCYTPNIPLRAYPDCFELNLNSNQKELMNKTFFPYTFLNESTLNFIGPIPGDTFFNKDAMSNEEQTRFLKWKSSFDNKDYDIQQEAIAYCVNDVSLLRMGYERFRGIFLEKFDVCVLHNCNTLASLSFKLYRQLHMPDKTICVVDDVRESKYSQEAMEWLSYVEYKLNKNLDSTAPKIRIHTVRSFGREAKVAIGSKRYKIDGLLPNGRALFNLPQDSTREDSLLFEFSGCIWRKHEACNAPNIVIGGLTGDERSRIQFEKESEIQKKYNLIVMYSCEWRKLQKSDEDVRTFLKQWRQKYSKRRLDVRASFNGGMVDSNHLFIDCSKMEEGTEIYYNDITSLYSHIMRESDFPVGQWENLLGDQISIEELEKELKETPNIGLINCQILPPQGLYNPILGIKIDNKLLFPICYSCAKNKSLVCNHSVQRRALKSVFTTAEIAYSLTLGYKILNIYEFMRFEKTEKIFNSFVQEFFKMKLQAEGIPSGMSRDEYLNFYAENGFQLDGDQCKKNKSIRTISKIILNAAFGRWGLQAQRFKHSQIVTSRQELWGILNDTTRFKVSEIYFGESNCLVYYKRLDDQPKQRSTVNVAIASYISSLARIYLHKEISKFKSTATIYNDTDSIINVSKDKGDYKITCPKLPLLGQFTNEIPNERGIKFVSIGPKCYSLKTIDENGTIKCTTKSKGFTLNRASESELNFESYFNLLINKTQRLPIKTTEFKKSSLGEITIQTYSKFLKYTYDKRKVLNPELNEKGEIIAIKTVPWGYNGEISTT
ncbi:unnamed protein product [Rotaria socialis]|nr:unnamed protein product [Rotaria socialis]